MIEDQGMIDNILGPMGLYSTKQDRPHQSFRHLTPDEVFYGLSSPTIEVA